MRNYITILFSALLSIFQAQAQNDYSFRQLYEIHTPASISISTSDGYIRAVKGNPGQVEVYYAVYKDNKLQDISLEELQEHLDIDIATSANNLSIAVRQPKKSMLLSWRNQYRVSFMIMAPPALTSELKTSDGNITVSGFTGRQQCRTSDGNIKITDVSNDISAHTSDGNIKVSDIGGAAELITSDGDIHATGVSGHANFRTSDGNIYANDIGDDMEATTSDGDINLENTRGIQTVKTSDGAVYFENVQGSLSARTSDGPIKGSISKPTQKLTLKTSDGNISVSVPRGLGMDLHLKGEHINAELNDFDGEANKHNIDGRIRGGGTLINLATSDGNIQLEEH